LSEIAGLPVGGFLHASATRTDKESGRALISGPWRAALRLPASRRAARASPPSTEPKEFSMLHYAIVFLVIALIAAVFGFGGIAAGAVGIAKILFFVFIIMAIVAFIAGRGRP
jgi:uncharacterized membrane protein YtjA (UPF0391 family)